MEDVLTWENHSMETSRETVTSIAARVRRATPLLNTRHLMGMDNKDAETLTLALTPTLMVLD
jgi:hypothetical protein